MAFCFRATKIQIVGLGTMTYLIQEIKMKTKMLTTLLVALTLVFSSNLVVADSIIETFTCKLKEGKKQKELQAINSKWLKWVNKHVDENIESSVGTAVVGSQETFMFADSYPDLATWAAAKAALDSDAAAELEDMFDGVSDCSENRLWKFEPTE